MDSRRKYLACFPRLLSVYSHELAMYVLHVRKLSSGHIRVSINVTRPRRRRPRRRKHKNDRPVIDRSISVYTRRTADSCASFLANYLTSLTPCVSTWSRDWERSHGFSRSSFLFYRVDNTKRLFARNQTPKLQSIPFLYLFIINDRAQNFFLPCFWHSEITFAHCNSVYFIGTIYWVRIVQLQNYIFLSLSWLKIKII